MHHRQWLEDYRCARRCLSDRAAHRAEAQRVRSLPRAEAERGRDSRCSHTWPRIRGDRSITMAITVQIPTALRRHTDAVGSICCAAANLGELFSVLEEKFPAPKPHLRDDQGQIRRFLNVYVNEEDIRFLGGQAYTFQDGDEILLVPSIAGGKD